MIGSALGRLAVRLAQLAHRLGTHHYLSTSCLHGDHDYCQSNTGLGGAKRPSRCKFCGTVCCCRICRHTTAA